MELIRRTIFIPLILLSANLMAQQLSPTLLTGNNLFPSSIYPLGWSPDGYFAYQFIAQTSTQLTDLGFVIVDTRTDKELFIYTEQNIAVSQQALVSFSNRHKALFERVLKRYNISRNAGQYKGLSFDDFVVTLHIDDPKAPLPRLTVTITKQNRKKIVAQESLKKGATSLALVTAIESPFEKRVAIIAVASYQTVSSKNYGHPIIYGAHLLFGFN